MVVEIKQIKLFVLTRDLPRSLATRNRKHTLSSQTNELESLEARLREMEDRLRRSTLPSGSVPPVIPGVQPSSAAAPAAPAPVPAPYSPPRNTSLPQGARRPLPPSLSGGSSVAGPSAPPTRRPQAPPQRKPVEEEDEDEEEEDEDEDEDDEDSDESDEAPPPPVAKDYPSSRQQQHAQQYQRGRGASVPVPRSQFAAEPKYRQAAGAGSSRVGGTRQAQPGGAMPPTPVASEGEYQPDSPNSPSTSTGHIQAHDVLRRPHHSPEPSTSFSNMPSLSSHSNHPGAGAAILTDGADLSASISADFVLVSKDGDTEHDA